MRLSLAGFDVADDNLPAGLPIASFQPQWGDFAGAGFVYQCHLLIEW